MMSAILNNNINKMNVNLTKEKKKKQKDIIKKTMCIPTLLL